jgi:hypothetical protein
MTLSFLEALVAILLIAAGWFVFVGYLDRRRMASFHKFQGKQMTDMAQRMVAARLDPGLHSNPPPTTDAPLGDASRAQEEWFVEIVERLTTLQQDVTQIQKQQARLELIVVEGLGPDDLANDVKGPER